MNINTFFKEKDLPYKSWEIEVDEEVHFIDSDVVIEHIKTTQGEEREQIKGILSKIDFANGDVHHFLHHLATGLATMKTRGRA